MADIVVTSSVAASLRSRGAIGGAYSTARTGTGLSVLGANNLSVGQQYSSSRYYCFEGFAVFDTSGVPDDATVTAVTLSAVGAVDASDTDCVIEVRARDFGDTVTIDDWVAGESISGSLLASFATSAGWTTGENTFTSEAAFAAAINKTGSTRLIFSSDRLRAGTTPTSTEYVQGAIGTTPDDAAGEPNPTVELTITYTAGAPSYLPGIMRHHIIPELGGR